MDDNARSSQHYAREAEATRDRLAANLAELTDRLTPGQMLDEVLTYAKAGSGTFARGLTNAAKDNPIPSLLIGAGCMMFLSEKMGGRLPDLGFGRRNSSPSYRQMAEDMSQGYRPGSSSMAGMERSNGSSIGDGVSGMARQASDMAQSAGARVGEMADGVKRTAADAVGSLKDGIGSAADSVTGTISGTGEQLRRTAHDMRDQVGDTADRLTGQVRDAAQAVGDRVQGYASAVGDQVSATQQYVTDTGRRATDRAMSVANEQPLLVAALGLAVGAAIAAILPSTRTEDELMGSTSDAVKKAAGVVAAEQFDVAKAAAGRVVGEAMSAAEKEGLTVSAAVDTARKVGDKVKEVVGKTAEAGKSELNDMVGSAKPH